MNNSSPQESDPLTTGTKAQLFIYMDAETNTIGFGTDWEDDESGIEAIADIFFQLKHKSLIEQILAVLYKQCVVEDRMDVFNKILKDIHSKVIDKIDDDDVAVRPTAQGAKYV